MPSDEAHQFCVGCSHQFVDEPDANKTMQTTYEQQLLKFNEQKAKAKENGSRKRLNPPKAPIPYRQCHCTQMFCVNPGNNIGSSCPIKCKKKDGSSYGVDDIGNCLCPICKCQCSLIYSLEAPQVIRTRQLLDDNSYVKQKEICCRVHNRWILF